MHKEGVKAAQLLVQEYLPPEFKKMFDGKQLVGLAIHISQAKRHSYSFKQAPFI